MEIYYQAINGTYRISITPLQYCQHNTTTPLLTNNVINRVFPQPHTSQDKKSDQDYWPKWIIPKAEIKISICRRSTTKAIFSLKVHQIIQAEAGIIKSWNIAHHCITPTGSLCSSDSEVLVSLFDFPPWLKKKTKNWHVFWKGVFFFLFLLRPFIFR